ncbi:MAG: LamG domain-containing protein [Aquirufa sp.]
MIFDKAMLKQIYCLISFSCIVLFSACEKDPAMPIGKGNGFDLVTSNISNVDHVSATSGILLSNLSNSITLQGSGICWGLNPYPTIDNQSYERVNFTTSAINIQGLIPAQKYYVRAYVKINGSYIYGNQQEFTTNPNNTLSANLVTYFPMNEDLRDFSGSGNNLNGSAMKTTDRWGARNSAFSFDGSTQYLFLISPKNLPRNNESYSLSFWFKANVWNREMAFCGYGPSGPNTGGMNYIKTLTNTGLMHAHWNLDGLITPYSYQGNWNHLVVTYDGISEIYYINGQNVGSWRRGANSLIINPTILSVGARVVDLAKSDIREYFNGSIDEIRIYSRTLNQSEVNTLYFSTK